MDFKLQDENHLGNIGVPPNKPGNYIYTHNQFGFQINKTTNVILRDVNQLRTLSNVLAQKNN